MAQCHQSQHQHEFLPLCDVLFNIISLASYFCDVVFDLAMVYALAHQAIAPPVLFPLSITLIATSLLISQVSASAYEQLDFFALSCRRLSDRRSVALAGH